MPARSSPPQSHRHSAHRTPERSRQRRQGAEVGR
jgi:hypothetical protein